MGIGPNYITVFCPSSIFCLWQCFVGVVGFPRRWHNIPIIFLLTLLDLPAILHLFWQLCVTCSVFLLALCVVSFFVLFPHLLGRPSFLYYFAIAHFRIFHRNFVMPVADVTSSPGRSFSSSANERMHIPRG